MNELSLKEQLNAQLQNAIDQDVFWADLLSFIEERSKSYIESLRESKSLGASTLNSWEDISQESIKTLRSITFDLSKSFHNLELAKSMNQVNEKVIELEAELKKAVEIIEEKDEDIKVQEIQIKSKLHGKLKISRDRVIMITEFTQAIAEQPENAKVKINEALVTIMKNLEDEGLWREEDPKPQISVTSQQEGAEPKSFSKPKKGGAKAKKLSKDESHDLPVDHTDHTADAIEDRFVTDDTIEVIKVAGNTMESEEAKKDIVQEEQEEIKESDTIEKLDKEANQLTFNLAEQEI